MNRDLEDLGRQLTGLTGRFVDLGAKLGDAARELQDGGAPPADALVEALGAARAQFLGLCADIVADAESLAIAVPSDFDSVKSLEPVLSAMAAAIAAQRRRALVAKARDEAVAVLDRVLGVHHQDDETFAPLVNCQQHADALKISALALDDATDEQLRTITDSVRPYADLLAMLEASEAVDDERFSSLEETVSKVFGRGLAVAAARGRLLLPGQLPPPPPVREPEPEPEPVARAPVVAEPVVAAPVADPVIPEPVVAAPPPAESATRELTLEEKLDRMPPPVYAPPPEPLTLEPRTPPPAPPPAPRPQPVAAAPSAPDETAQWWLAAWARWSGWKGTLSVADAAKEEISKYPFLLSVPIQKAPEYEDGLLAYGYSIIMEHIEAQSPGCVGNALNNLKAGQGASVGDQLYDYLVEQGRLTETYPEFLKTVLLAVIPEPGLWVQARIIHSKDDTRVFQRPSARIGETEQTAQRFLADNQRFTEHRFSTTLPAMTARCFLVSAELRDAHGLEVRVKRGGEASDSAWIVTVPSASKASAKVEARRAAPEGTPLPAIGRDYSAVWVALFNADPKREAAFQLGLALRKDARGMRR
jgi:hypothetical protein